MLGERDVVLDIECHRLHLLSSMTFHDLLFAVHLGIAHGDVARCHGYLNLL